MEVFSSNFLENTEPFISGQSLVEEYGNNLDIEFAFNSSDEIFILQARPITTNHRSIKQQTLSDKKITFLKTNMSNQNQEKINIKSKFSC